MLSVQNAAIQNGSSWRVLVDEPVAPSSVARPPAAPGSAVATVDSATVLSLSSDARAVVADADQMAPFEGLKAAHSPAELAEIREKMQGQLLLTGLERRNPEGAQALRDAIANGTVKTQRAADVPGVNYKSKETFTYESNGQVKSQMVGLGSFNPSSAIQTIIDAGRGAPMWQSGVGDVWVTW